MSSLAICRHEHKKWSMFAVANTSRFLLLILHIAFLCSQHLCDNRGATEPDSLHRRWMPKKHLHSLPSLVSEGRFWDLKEIGIQEIQILKHNLLILLGLHCIGQGASKRFGTGIPLITQSVEELWHWDHVPSRTSQSYFHIMLQNRQAGFKWSKPRKRKRSLSSRMLSGNVSVHWAPGGNKAKPPNIIRQDIR